MMRLASPLSIILIVLTGCQNRIELPDPEPEYEQVTVKFNVNNELKEVGTFADSKSLATYQGSDDLIAIQINQRFTPNSSTYKSYCYGLWDNSSNLEVMLNKGLYYNFEVTVVPNGKLFVAKSLLEDRYMEPFQMAGIPSAEILNRFIYSTTDKFSGLGSGQAAIKNDNTFNLYDRPTLDRYYGLEEAVLISDGLELTLNVKRVVFGLKYEIKDFTEGEVTIEIESSPPIVLTPSNHAIEQTIVTMKGSWPDPKPWMSDDYKEEIKYKIYYKKNGSPKTEIDSRTSQVQRRKIYNMQISLAGDKVGDGLSIVFEEAALDDGGNI